MKSSAYDVWDEESGTVVQTVVVDESGFSASIPEKSWNRLVERYGPIQFARANGGGYRLLKLPGYGQIAKFLPSYGGPQNPDRCPKCKGRPKFVRTALMCCGQVLGGF
jgi:hypothetical protein